MKTLCAAVLLLLAASTLSAAVTISTIAPASGLTRGGEIVHIHGTNMFDPALGCPAPLCSWYVNFGDAPATILDITSTDLVVVAPPHAAGTVNVEVHPSLGGSLLLESAFVYQEPQSTDQVRLLVPIAAGAGTWQADLFAYNGSSEALIFGSSLQIAPFATRAVTLAPPPGNAGAFVYVPKRIAGSVTWNLRVHDTARDADGWGVDIPVVPESQFRRSVVLAGIPSDARFRTLLRIYSFSGPDAVAQVTLRDDATGDLLQSLTVTLQSGAYTQRDVAPQAPAYTQIAIDPLVPAGHARVRAEITGVANNAPPLWAFVSVTNNVTQQVTTVKPAIVTSALSQPATLLAGNWFAGNGQVAVDGNEVQLTLGCETAKIPMPVIGPDGRFELDVVMYPSFPVGRADNAHISGIVQGTTLRLTVTYALGAENYVLTFHGTEHWFPDYACLV